MEFAKAIIVIVMFYWVHDLNKSLTMNITIQCITGHNCAIIFLGDQLHLNIKINHFNSLVDNNNTETYIEGRYPTHNLFWPVEVT